MSEKRRDSKGRVLRNGESQRSDGKYMFRYTDGTGERHTVYSWKLVSTDKLKEGQRDSQALRDMEKRILKDLDDSIKTRDAEHTTVDDLFDQFMDIRKDLRESSRCCYNDIYRKHIKPVIGHRPIGRVKPTEIQKLYQIMVSESGVNPTTAQKAHSIIYQLFENAVMDNIIRVNPASNAFRNFRKTAELNPACREPLTVEQQELFIDYIRYRISAPKTEAGFREIPMFDAVKAALQRERGKRKSKKKKFVVDGYSDFVFLNNNGQVYTQSFIYDTIQGITTSYNKEEYAKALEEKREPCYLPKISAHILRHTFCTRMCEQNINIKVLQDVMGHRNIRTTMETYAKAFRDKKIEAVMALNGAFKIS